MSTPDSIEARAPWLTLFLLVPLFILLAAPGPAEANADSEAVRVWLPSEGLESSEILLQLGGEQTKATRIEGSSSRWQIVLYLDQTLSRSGSLHLGADLLLGRLPELAELGDLAVVHADPQPTTSIPSTTDSTTLETGLYDVLFRTRGRDRVRHLRSAFRRAQPAQQQQAVEALSFENDLLRSQQDELLGWIAEQGPSERPRLLLLASELLALDPTTFYLEGMSPELLLGARPGAPWQEIVEVATAYGWVVAPVQMPPSSASKRLDLAQSVDVPIGLRVRFGSGKEAKEASETELLPDSEIGLEKRASQPLVALARDTGGRLIESERALLELLGELAMRRPWRLEIPGHRVAEVLDLELPESQFGVSSRAPSKIALAPPRAVSGARTRRFLRTFGQEGELPIEALIEASHTAGSTAAAPFVVQADLSSRPPGEQLRLRITTGVHRGQGELLLKQEPIGEPVLGRDRPWQSTGSLRLPEDTDSVVFLVEQIGGVAWGLASATFVPSLGELEQQGILDLARLEPPTRLIRIVSPPEPPSRRRIDLEARADPSISRVVFEVNGVTAAVLEERPFAARLKLERKARSHVIEAIAFDGEGTELARDRLVINAPSQSFWVRILEPQSGELIGPVEVEAEVRVPEGEELDRVDFYWNDQLFATSRQPPYRQRMLVPFRKPEGFIRVEAKLADGSATDDLVLMNSTQFGERVNVEIVELLVVVTDDSGEPVLGLPKDDFTVFEDDSQQEIEQVSSAGDLPLTVGLAIDSSLSLFKRFEKIQIAARSFVESLVEGRDRAFLVGFGSEPAILQQSTSNLDSVANGIEMLHPSGLTLIWQGAVLSLLELEHTKGRKALVVFYDGDDEDEKSSHREAVSQAKRLGIPVYLIVMNNAAARTQGQSFRVRSFTKRLEELANAGGGRVYYVRTSDDLRPVFERISDELRSHYRLTYTPVSGADSTWRNIEVRMKKADLEARTVSGYEPETEN